MYKRQDEDRNVFVFKKEMKGSDGEVHEEHKVHKVKIRHADMKGMSEEERAALKAEIAEAMAEMKVELAEAREAHKIAMLEMKDSMGEMVTIEANCESNEPVTEKLGSDGKKVMMICQTAITAQARDALKQARASIAAQSEMDEEMRATVLEALDEEIRNFDREG